MRGYRHGFFAAVFLVAVIFAGPVRAQMDSDLTVNVKDSPLRNVLEMIAARAGLQLVMGRDVNVNVSLTQTGMSARKILDQIAAEQQIEYTISGSQLIVTRRGVGGSIGDSHMIHLNYVSAADVAAKVSGVVAGDERIMLDERENNLIFMGSKSNFEKIRSLAMLFDSPPKQILIEGLIVETSHSFMRQLGVSFAALGIQANVPQPTSPNLSFTGVLDGFNSKTLEVQLAAAESNGEAKIVSRPKVMTLNNQAARIQSGLTYFVKTLANVPIGNGPGGAANVGAVGGGAIGGGAMGGFAVGGVTPINAGLTLRVLPLLVGDEEIRMTVDINNSTSDMGNSVDGIPGIMQNSANTAVIVRNKQTAVIAGLIKQAKSKTSSGVPFLQDIPLIGSFFKSRSVTDNNNELVIFLTPSIGGAADAVKPESYTTKELKAPEAREVVERTPSNSAWKEVETLPEKVENKPVNP
jgi:type IV pilus assembly protein PilQ